VDWYDDNNEEALECRRLCNVRAMEDMVVFLNQVFTYKIVHSDIYVMMIVFYSLNRIRVV
jgi:hypothetical protein